MAEETVEAVEGASAETGVTEGAETTAPALEAPQEPAYTPNYKYRVGDEEKEFDEDVRAMVTNEKIEKKLRDLYSASGGLPTIKQERDQFRQQFGELTGRLRDVASYVQKRDLDNAFKQLGIEDRLIYEWVEQKIKLSQLPQDQRALYDQNRQAINANEMLERNYKALEQQTQQIASQHRELELHQALGGAEVKSIADKFDALRGSGAFRQEVIELGVAAYRNTGRDISAQEAVRGVMAKYGPLLAQAGVPQAQANQAKQTVVVTQPKQPSIPQVGKAGSPGQQPYRRIADLKARGKALQAAGE